MIASAQDERERETDVKFWRDAKKGLQMSALWSVHDFNNQCIGFSYMKTEQMHYTTQCK